MLPAGKWMGHIYTANWNQIKEISFPFLNFLTQSFFRGKTHWGLPAPFT